MGEKGKAKGRGGPTGMDDSSSSDGQEHDGGTGKSTIKDHEESQGDKGFSLGPDEETRASSGHPAKDGNIEDAITIRDVAHENAKDKVDGGGDGEHGSAVGSGESDGSRVGWKHEDGGHKSKGG